MNLTQGEARLVGYLLENGDTRFVTLCTELDMQVAECVQVIEGLMKKNIITNRGYAAHTDCWYVPDSGEWRHNRNKNLEEVGKAYVSQL